MILTFTDSDQTNIGFNSESSTGKSYLPLEISWYFPKEDVLKFGYVSPTAFFHDAGVLLPDPQDPGDPDDPERKPRKIIWIDLEKKILIFLDQPHDMLLQRLRPLLSHDEKVIIHKITDRAKRGSLMTKRVWIQGYPTVIFCTAKFSMDEQERTRVILLSPETTREKIREAIMLKIEKDSDKDAFQEYMDSDPRRQWLKNRVEDVKQEDIKNIIIPEDLKRKIQNKFLDEHENLIPRHQRDIGRLMAMIKAHCLLNLWSRERKDENIIASETDVDEGFRIYSDVARSNDIGLPPEVFNVFKDLEPNIPENGITRKDFLKLYYGTFHRTLGVRRFREIVDIGSAVGIISEEPDPNDRKQNLILLTGRVLLIEKAENRANLNQTINNTQGVSSTFKSLTRIPFPREGTCRNCGSTRVLYWRLEAFDGEGAELCEDCGKSQNCGILGDTS